MKKLFLCFFILISIDSFAQTSVYHPFPDSNVVWNVEISSQCSVGLADRFWMSYIIEGDTIIGLNSYHKVYEAWVIQHWQCMGIDYSYPGNYYGALRQDTTARTVYFFSFNDTIERLYYDFNLHAGDTIRTYLQSTCYAGDTIISEEDSVLINGNYRKRWKIPVFFGPEYIIEGIGNTSGPFFPVCTWFEGGAVLVCCTQDNIVLFQDSMFTSTPGLCGLIDAIPPIETKQEVRLYPNPLQSESVLETLNFPSVLSIFNNMGQLVKQQQINSASTIITSGLMHPGIYTFCIQSLHANPVFMKVLVVK